MLTHLTEKFIDNLDILNNKKEYILQITNIIYNESNEILNVELSNGFVKKDFFLFPEMSEEQKNLLKKNINSILSVSIIYSQNIFILRYFKVELECDKIIGQPIEYNTYKDSGFSNDKGTNMIPWKYIKLIEGNESINNNIINNFNNLLSNSENFTLIKDIVPESMNIVRVRIVKKTNIRSFYKKEGKLFTCELVDNSGYIKGNFFNEFVDKFHNLINQGDIYKIENLEFRKSNFSKGQLEAYFNKFTKIEKLPDCPSIPYNNFEFYKLSEIENKNLGCIVDNISVVLKDNGLQDITLRSGGSKPKRTYIIIDDSGSIVELVIWGKEAEDLKFNEGDVILLNQLKISQFNNKKQLSFYFNSYITTNIKLCTRYTEIIKWKIQKFDEFKNKRQEEPVKGTVEYKYPIKTLEDIDHEFKNSDKKFEIYNTIWYVTYISDNYYYASCPSDDCKKKLVENITYYECVKCKKEVKVPINRFLTSIKVADSTKSMFIMQMGNEINEIIFGKTLNELNEIDNNNLKSYLEQRKFVQYKCLLKAYKSNYKDVETIKYSIIKCGNYNSNTQFLLKSIENNIAKEKENQFN